ncbi:uncharacterized protein LOC115015023 [Cottoperca gobio]|uniref:Uncharacterized protein LOC115015023 n=1 Tax=Cottoperca gobio TaxID=56716 RepID=A0A6J2QL52_COTGO|nr:uncharacterized protein LOC115015023 [Cottoperca gobio]
MWCYQKPGFEALLLAELQRQQQCSQFCDTLLKTEGVSVPAHSCILSAISPHIASALSSMPPPPAGQSHLLEFRALGACTLLHMVRLLYCGEMTGEGEKEKQEAILTAAKLGIHGLVEVTKRDHKSRSEEGKGWHSEVGVQTDPLMPEEDEGRRGRWRREVRDGSTFLWKETHSDGMEDTQTQTEELQEEMSPPSHPAASLETIDMATFQNLGQAESHLFPPQIPYIPISLFYPPDGNQTHQPSSALVDSMQESITAAGHTSVVAPPHTFVPPTLPFLSQAGPCADDLQSWWAGPQGAARDDAAAAEEWEHEQLEQFQGNIPGYISYFLNPDKEDCSGRGRARRRRGAGVGGARRAGTSGRRARRPRARTGGRGRGGLTQTVAVQVVGVGKLQKLFMQRWGVRSPRTGQGGGAVGRKLFLKTRELLKPAKNCQRGRGRRKVWEFSQIGDVLPYSEGGGGNTQRGRKRPTQQIDQPSASPGLLSPAASYMPPASSLLHSTSLPPPAPPPHEQQPEHFNCLLEEMMMGLDILPINNDDAPHFQPPLSTSSSSCDFASCGNALAQNKQQVRSTGLLEGLHGSTPVVAVARGAGSSNSSNSEMPVLQQHGEGELNEMLDHFLQSLEQHVDSCTAGEEAEMGGQSCTEVSQPYSVLRKCRKTNTQTTKTPHTPRLQNTHTPHPARRSQITELENDEAEIPPRRSQSHKSSARSAPPKHTEGSPGKVGAPARKKERRNQRLFSLERKSVRKPESCDQILRGRRDKQLQRMPVVKLERSGPLPAKVTLQERSCLEVKDRVPIPPPSAGRRRGRPKKNGQFHSLSNERSTPSVQPQPVEPCSTDEQPERNQERHEEKLSVQPQEEVEGAARRGEKRRADSEETSDESTVTKRVCFEQMSQPTSETCVPSSPSADFVSKPATKEIMAEVSIETISTAGDCLQREDREGKTTRSEIKLRETEESLMDEEMESNYDEIIIVHQNRDRESEDLETCQRRTAPAPLSPSSHSAKEVVSLRSTGSWEEDKDEDIDVIGGSSPVRDPVLISWTESSEVEEEEGDEDIDVEKTDYAPSAVFAT